MRVISNNKELVRYRRERNLVAKNNKHKGGVHSTPKCERRPKLTGCSGMTTEELNDWWEGSI